MEKTSQLAPTVLFTAINRLERHRLRRSCNTPAPACCCAIRYWPSPTSWMDSEKPGTHVSSLASNGCGRERNDKKPPPVYYAQRGLRTGYFRIPPTQISAILSSSSLSIPMKGSSNLQAAMPTFPGAFPLRQIEIEYLQCTRSASRLSHRRLRQLRSSF